MSDDEEYYKLKEAYHNATELYSGASLDADKLHDELKAVHAALGVAQQEAAQEQDEKVVAEAEVQISLSTLQPPVTLPSPCR